MNLTIFTISIAFSTFGYVIYMALTSSVKIRTILSPGQIDNANHIFFQRLAGLAVFGIIPALSAWFFTDINFSNYGISISLSKETFFWIILLAVVILPVNFLNSKKPDNLSMYPQIRNSSWSAGLFIASALSWILYLLAYEWLFRGFLLFSSLEIMGYWPAIILNTGIYSLAHYPKGLKEALGAIPFGIIICILVLKTNSFWVAFIAHITLALSNEWFSLYASEIYKTKN